MVSGKVRRLSFTHPLILARRGRGSCKPPRSPGTPSCARTALSAASAHARRASSRPRSRRTRRGPDTAASAGCTIRRRATADLASAAAPGPSAPPASRSAPPACAFTPQPSMREHVRDASVAVAAESTRESHDITSERPLVTRHFPRPALGRAWLPEHPARSPLRRPELLTYTHHTTSSALGAQKFPLAASSTISLSSVKSATARFRRPFLALELLQAPCPWLTLIPPYSRLHR